MTMNDLFSFTGRTNRAKYWLITLYLILATIVISILTWLGFAAIGYAAFVLLLLFLPMIWIGLALAIRRLHDRDKSGWWVLFFYFLPAALQNVGDQVETPISLLFYLPSLVISIWAFVEFGFFKGTDGPNQYGPDPLQPVGSAQPA